MRQIAQLNWFGWSEVQGKSFFSSVLLFLTYHTFHLPCSGLWISTTLQVCGVTPCVRDTDHLFLELPQLREKLEKYIDETSVAGSWSQNAIHITDSWLKEGLKPRCITRDLKWGVPVPHEKYKDKVCHLSTKRLVGKMCVSMFALIVVIVMNGFRCSMSGLMRRLGISPSQHATRPSGRNGGRTQRMLNYISSWAKITSHFIP